MTDITKVTFSIQRNDTIILEYRDKNQSYNPEVTVKDIILISEITRLRKKTFKYIIRKLDDNIETLADPFDYYVDRMPEDEYREEIIDQYLLCIDEEEHVIEEEIYNKLYEKLYYKEKQILS